MSKSNIALTSRPTTRTATRDPLQSEAARASGGTTIRLNTFRSARDKVPTARDLDWGAACREIKKLITATTAQRPRSEAERKRFKTDLPAFNTATLTEAYNENENVEHLTALPIDVDSGDLIATHARAEAAGIDALIYTSPSHPNADGTDRFRVLVPLDAPLAPGDVKHARKALAELLGIGPGQGVERADAASQIFFGGRFKGDDPCGVFETRGKPVSTEFLTLAILKGAWSKPTIAKAVPALDRLGIEDPDERTAALLGALEPHWAKLDEHREALRALGGYLARRGWTDEQIAAVARGLAPDRPVTNRVSLAVECARSTRASDGEIGAGWSTLVAKLGDAAALIESHAKDPLEPEGWPGVWDQWWRKAHAPGGWVYKSIERTAAKVMATAGTAGTERPKGGSANGHLLGKRHLFSDPEVPINYLCEGLCLAASDGKISLIAGEPGGGKGPIANHLAVCFAFGLKAFGAFECTQTKVLLLDCEGARLTMRRLRRLARGAGRKPEELDEHLQVWDTSTQSLIDADGSTPYVDALRAHIAKHSIGVVVLDSYTSAMLASGIEANSPQFASLAKALGSLDVLVLAVAHANKAASNRDGDPRLSDIAHSGAFGAMAQTAIVVSYPSKDDRHTIRVGCARAPETGFAGFCVRFSDALGDALRVTMAERSEQPEAAKETAQRARVAERADSIENALKSGVTSEAHTVSSVKSVVGLNSDRWREALDECLRRGSVIKEPGPRKSIALRYVHPDNRDVPSGRLPPGNKFSRRS